MNVLNIVDFYSPREVQQAQLSFSVSPGTVERTRSSEVDPINTLTAPFREGDTIDDLVLNSTPNIPQTV